MTGQARVGLVDELSALLRERLYGGRYPAGTVISQAATAVELGVSRTPLREALRLLAAEGLVRPDPAGAIVVGMTVDRWRAALPMRLAVDELAAALCADAVRSDPGGPASRDLLALDPAVAVDQVPLDEQDFHLALLRAGGNEFVQEQGTLVRRTTVLAEPLLPVDPVRATRREAEHRAILAAILDGDAQAAAVAAREHQLAVDRDLAAAG